MKYVFAVICLVLGFFFGRVYSLVFTAKSVSFQEAVRVDCFVDFDSSGNVDIVDLVFVAREFGNSISDSNRRFDGNSDGFIDIVDVVLVAREFGKSCLDIRKSEITSRLAELNKPFIANKDKEAPSGASSYVLEPDKGL